MKGFKKGHTINNGRVQTQEHKEKIRAGLARAKANGKALGHPPGMTTWNKGMSKANGDPLTYGRPRTDETKKNISESLKGKPLSEEHKKKVSNTLKGRRCSPRTEFTTELMKSRYRDPAYVAKMQVAWNMKPNKAEMFLMGLLDRLYPGEWKYTGDFSMTINGKCPDFVNCNGQKKIIELFGDYWHRDDDPEKRKEVFAPFGYETLIVWERELENVNLLQQTLDAFVENKHGG